MGSIWLLVLLCIAVSVLLRLTTAYILGTHTDQLALLALKDQMTAYPSWSNMNSWNDSNHFCDWGGVTCSRRHQRVVMLNLQSQGLTGSLSPYLGNLSFLRNISLANNSLHGQIPQEIGRLFRLRELLIHNNSLSGPLPGNLSHCVNLENLVLAYNNLTGKIPEELGSCTKLQFLKLQTNGLTGRIPASFGNLTSLYSLNLVYNNLDGSIPSSLTQLERLKHLSLPVNRLSGKFPPLLYNISSLELFFLTENQLEGCLPHDIGLNLPLLTSFGVASNNFTGPIPVSLFSNSTNIQLLDLGENNFTGNVPVEIGRLKHLQRFSVPKNLLGSGGESGNDLDFVTSLNNCSNLQIMSISFNQFGGNLPAFVSNLSQLELLYIGHNPITGSIPSEIDNLSNLIVFSAQSNFLTGTIPKRIGMIQNLQQLDLTTNTLSGKIPYSIGNITSLYYIDLSQNMLSGTIVARFEKCPNLQIFFLNGNNLTGIIPQQLLGSLSQLVYIDLSHNHLSGSLPLEVGKLINLYGLDLSENKIGGEIPSTLGDCVVLHEIFLQGNFLQGIIPSSFSYLKSLQFIDLSRNNLSGKIPKDLQDLVYLESLNLSFNNFDGEVPTRRVFRNASRFSIAGNYKLCGGVTELHLPNCFISKSEHAGLSLAVKITIGLLLPCLLASSLFLVLYSRNKSTAIKQLMEENLQRVSYNELWAATNGFSSENLIGVGSFGSVYKGFLGKNQSFVAVKVLNLFVRGASKSFMAECEILRRVRHRNLLKILTVCSSIDTRCNDFKALIYQFMPNGSLESWLHPSVDSSQRPSNFLNLLQRLNIAIDIASALDYLHNYSQAPIIHCDLKPSNVLLDDNMVAYVGDFGLAKFLHKSNTSNSDKSQTDSTNQTDSTAVRGTIGYIPPEYGMGSEVTKEGDVYSYGIMLMEMFTGKRPTDEMFKDNLSLRSFCESNTTNRLMEIIDMHLLEETTNESATDEIQEQTGITNAMKECLISVLELGFASSSESASERMGIKDVLSNMHKIRDAFVSN